MAELVSIQNKSPKAKSIVFSGRQIIIDGHGSGDFDKEVADRFLDAHHGVVTRAEDIGTVYEADLPNQDMVWLANMTGDPDAPDTIQGASHWNKSQGQFVSSSQPHPCKDAITITRDYDMGQKEYIAKDGAPEGLNLQSVAIKIPPYTRRQFPKEIGTWMLMRDGTAGKECSGRIKKSRPPSPFEPDLGWSLDDMRSYLQLCSPGADLGPTEADLKAANKGNGKELEAETDKAKRKVWTRLFFCLADPSVRLPTRSEFNEFVSDRATGTKG